MTRLTVAVALAACAACAPATPADALQAYARALTEKDAETVHRLSGPEFRETYTVEDVRRCLEQQDPPLRTLEAALREGPAGRWVASAEIEVASGRRMRLVQGPDGWRVADGGLVPFSAATPQAGLQSFFTAVDAGRLEQVRRLIPARHLSRLGEDAALRAHLEGVMDRIDQARASITDLASFETDGARARLVYGPGRSVRMERESGTWKVVDLE